MDISRRVLMQGMTAGAATVLAQPRLFASQERRFANPLQIPPLLDGAIGPAGRTFQLAVASGRSGGVVGSIAGTRLNAILAPSKRLLNRIFGGGVIAVGGMIAARGLPILLDASTN